MTALGELPSTTTGLPLAAVWGFPAPPSLLPPGIPVGTSLGALTQLGIFAQVAGGPSGILFYKGPLTTFFTSVFDPTFGGAATGSLYPIT